MEFPTSTSGLIPPHSPATEATIVATLVDNPTWLDEIHFLKPEHFYTFDERAAFTAMLALAGRGEAIELGAVVNELVASGVSERFRDFDGYVRNRMQTPATGQLAKKAAELVKLAAARRLQTAAQTAASFGYSPEVLTDVDGYIERATALMAEALESGTNSKSRLASEEYEDLIAELEADRSDMASVGVPTGFRDLDALLRLRPGSVNVFAARPGMGKTAFGIAVLVNAIRQQVEGERPTACALFTLEMSNQDVVRRLAAATARVPLSKLMRHELSEVDKAKLHDNRVRPALSQLHLDASTSTVGDMRIRVRQMRRRADELGHELRIVAIDYMQLMKGVDPRHREQEVAAISRGLKRTALDEGLIFIVMSQLNRSVEGRTEPRPKLSDLRESGAIEQDADTVSFLFREDYYNRTVPGYVADDTCIVDVAKNRHGPCGPVTLGFEAEFTSFFDRQPAHTYHTEAWNYPPRRTQ